MLCNLTKRKQLSNYRSSTKEIDAGLKVPRSLTLEAALEWIADDELVEATSGGVTPAANTRAASPGCASISVDPVAEQRGDGPEMGASG